MFLFSLFFFFSRLALGCKDTDVNVNKMSNNNKVSVTVGLIFSVEKATVSCPLKILPREISLSQALADWKI